MIKMMPLLKLLGDRGRMIHTGQHFDDDLSGQFLRELGLGAPMLHLEVGGRRRGSQIGDATLLLEEHFNADPPEVVVVHGDTNAALAGALAANASGIPLVHVESGLRSFDRAMPEEINRVLTDQISELLFTTEQAAEQNLQREGIAAGKVHFVGNVMIDSLLQALPRAVPPEQIFAPQDAAFGAALAGGFAAATLHRPVNVDDPDVLRRLLTTFGAIADRLPLVLPLHPRTARMIAQHGLSSLLERPAIRTVPPQPYLVMVGLLKGATVVLTDSGGIQEETTGLGVPCLTLRENTERPITVAEGTNIVVGTDPGRILGAVDDILASGGKTGRIPPLWDGHAAERIARYIGEFFELPPETGASPRPAAPARSRT
jgi:UDP-N-acetylglucosamine 2-epimerase (non-hydrolysing)